MITMSVILVLVLSASGYQFWRRGIRLRGLIIKPEVDAVLTKCSSCGIAAYIGCECYPKPAGPTMAETWTGTVSTGANPFLFNPAEYAQLVNAAMAPSLQMEQMAQSSASRACAGISGYSGYSGLVGGLLSGFVKGAE